MEQEKKMQRELCPNRYVPICKHPSENPGGQLGYKLWDQTCSYDLDAFDNLAFAQDFEKCGTERSRHQACRELNNFKDSMQAIYGHKKAIQFIEDKVIQCKRINDEKQKNLWKMIQEEFSARRKLFEDDYRKNKYELDRERSKIFEARMNRREEEYELQKINDEEERMRMKLNRYIAENEQWKEDNDRYLRKYIDWADEIKLVTRVDQVN